MGTITALTAQKRNNDRINVFLDGAFAFGLAAVVAAHLRVGQSLTPATITSLQEEDSVEKAKEKALNFITYRPRSVAEVERKLRDKGFDESVTTRVVERLQAVDLLDDMAFARYWVEQRETFKPRSRLALQQELREKGVARSVIEAV
jgi:regulatory protein